MTKKIKYPPRVQWDTLRKPRLIPKVKPIGMTPEAFEELIAKRKAEGEAHEKRGLGLAN